MTEGEWLLAGIAWLVISFGIIGLVMMNSAKPGEADPDEVDRQRFKRYMEREWHKAQAGAHNADQWAKDLLETWKANGGK